MNRIWRLYPTLRRGSLTILFCVITAAGAVGVWAAMQNMHRASSELSSMLPQGPLLAIEAKDFAGLLKRWSESPEKAKWIKGDNYSVFSNSRLFGRLGAAQDEFAQAAGLPPDMSFLSEVAGKESIFAWYDIGNLEFLYITHMPSGTAEKTRLLQMRGKFATRQIGNQAFYVKTHGDAEKGETPRTVAFATRGDWLLLATREDLMAGALTLMASAENSTAAGPAANSLAAEPWFVDARAAAKDSGDLRMSLNLEKIVPTAYFRSYWVQQNVTEMKQYRSAVADLYLDSSSFREERVLLRKSAADNVQTTSNLAALTALLPRRFGVYRAVAAPTLDAATAGIDEELIGRGTSSYSDPHIAPVADLAVHEEGSASDLETRIDTAPIASPAKGTELLPLRSVLEDSGLDAMMTVNRTGEPAGGIWVPFQSALVLSSKKDWDAAAMQSALQKALGARLMSSNLGLQWKRVQTKAGDYMELSDVRHLELAVLGKICILTDDPALMQEILVQNASKTPNTADAGPMQLRVTTMAGFDPPSERASFARWTRLVDRSSSGPAQGSDTDGGASEPAFFAGNMRSLSDTFAALEQERMIERTDGALTRQTVTYAWRH